jgi:hypothetical protein
MKPAADSLLRELAQGSERERAAYRTILALIRLATEQDDALRLADGRARRFQELTYRSYALATEAIRHLQQRERDDA